MNAKDRALLDAADTDLNADRLDRESREYHTVARRHPHTSPARHPHTFPPPTKNTAEIDRLERVYMAALIDTMTKENRTNA
jgi:hypothetical protein